MNDEALQQYSILFPYVHSYIKLSENCLLIVYQKSKPSSKVIFSEELAFEAKKEVIHGTEGTHFVIKKENSNRIRLEFSILKLLTLLELLDIRSLFYGHDQNVRISQRRQLLQKEYRLRHGQRFHLDKFSYRVDGKGLNHQLRIDHLHA